MHTNQSDQMTLGEISSSRWNAASIVWFAIVGAWFAIISWVPDPRPLSTPDWVVQILQEHLVSSEPVARLIATIALRSVGFGLLGGLLSLATVRWSAWGSWTTTLIGAAILAIVSQSIQYGHFPVTTQMQLSTISSLIGGLIGLSLRRSGMAIGILMSLTVGVMTWGLSTGVSNDLDSAARMTGLHLLSLAQSIPDGDNGFEILVERAFAFAEDNSHGTNAVIPNQAAIVALGVILGDERIVRIAGRKLEIGRAGEMEALRARITLGGRNDLSRHFWVSAALTVLSDEGRALAVGIGKELMDSIPGGSGFSFVDLLADRGGIRFAVSATKNKEAARAMQSKILDKLNAGDYLPSIEGLPEGISSEVFQAEYGGLNGTKTQHLNEEIIHRLTSCKGLTIEL
jgi:hypothetical protein